MNHSWFSRPGNDCARSGTTWSSSGVGLLACSSTMERRGGARLGARSTSIVSVSTVTAAGARDRAAGGSTRVTCTHLRSTGRPSYIS